MNTTRMEMRAARPADLAAVQALLREAGLPENGLEEQFGEEYVVAEEPAGRLLAAAGVEVHGRYGLLRSVVVGAGQRGRGLGERLVRDRMRWAEERGLAGVYLLTTTAPDFFARLGFERVRREEAPREIAASREFASVCPASAEVMARRCETRRCSPKDFTGPA